MIAELRHLPVTWENLEPVFEELLTRDIPGRPELEQWMLDRSRLEAYLQEDYAWRYIRMTCNTEDQQLLEDFQFYATQIEPRIAPFSNRLDKKLYESPFRQELDPEKYRIYLRKVANSIELFREENIPVLTDIQIEQQRYQSITGAMMVDVDGKPHTLAQAATFLRDPDRQKRAQVWQKIAQRRLADKNELNELLDKLIALRHQVAINAGFTNFRDYMFREMGRFDYSVKDCEDFHEAIATHVVPVLQELAGARRQALGLDVLRPWDMDVDTTGLPALKPFRTGEELVSKTIACFAQLDPYIGGCLEKMQQRGLFDVESRKGKTPGGYNYPLAATGMPFIFMNAAGTFEDLTTMVHEGGHALHTFLSADLALNDFKDVPSEVAELASMGMELISMKHWSAFFTDPDDLRRARLDQLADVLKTLPWVATVDSFQHWLYLHPGHTVSEREAAWGEIYQRFGGGCCAWKDQQQEALANLWQKQLHIYEVPFYYIEYGMAQLGAIALWKNYLENPRQTLEQYFAALRLGYTRTIPEIYRTAGIRFDFSAGYVRELADFIQKEYRRLYFPAALA